MSTLRRTDTRYQEVVDYLRHEIQSGGLPQGARVPTQRKLAEILNISLPTVTKGFAEAQRMGLISSEVGRGTFVRRASSQAPDVASGPRSFDMTINTPATSNCAPFLEEELSTLLDGGRLDRMSGYLSPQEESALVASVRRWLSDCRVSTEAARVCLTAGAHNALFLALSALSRPGQTIATGGLVYPGLFAIAQELGLTILPVDSDQDGLLPKALDVALSEKPDAFVFLNPTFENPTGIRMPSSRRIEIAEVCRANGAIIIEDEVYRHFDKDPARSFLELAPERTVFITSLSKVFAPSLRLGAIAANADLMTPIFHTSEANQYALPTLSCALALSWLSEKRFKLLAAHRSEIEKRRQLASKVLDIQLPDGCYHAWYPSSTWEKAESIIADAAHLGLKLPNSRSFRVTGAVGNPGVRLVLGSFSSLQDLEGGLTLLRDAIWNIDRPRHTM